MTAPEPSITPSMRLPANYNNLSPTERRKVRELYVTQQNGKCKHCGASLTGEPAERVRRLPVKTKLFPENFFRWPVHLHHDHSTGMTIGAVHCYCNAVLWQYHGE